MRLPEVSRETTAGYFAETTRTLPFSNPIVDSIEGRLQKFQEEQPALFDALKFRTEHLSNDREEVIAQMCDFVALAYPLLSRQAELSELS